MDLVLRNARLSSDEARVVEIGVASGKIAAIAPKLDTSAQTIDAGGRLVVPGFVESHIHLDKSHIFERATPETERMAYAVKRTAAVKRAFTVEDVAARARRTLDMAVAQGVTRMRTHVEVDPGIGLRGWEGIKPLVDEYRWAIDIELCVFPQEGLTNNPGTDELMLAGLRDGARVVGAAPGYDSDHPGQIRRIFELARDFDVDIDMHLDFGNTAEDMDLPLVCELTQKYRWGGRVAVDHVTKLSLLPPEKLREMARRLADAGVAAVILPATDLYLMGRDQAFNVRRGIVDANLLAEEGVTCTIGCNNIVNPFTPFGDCSLVRMANLQANVLQKSTDGDLDGLFEMTTHDAAKMMRLADYGIEVGKPADLVVVDATSRAQAVREVALPMMGFKRGRRSFTRPLPELHRP
jgi:cytosine/creatinine deaminase